MKFVTHFYFLSYSFHSSFFSYIIFFFIFFSLRKYASVSRCYLQKRNCWAGKSWYVRSIFLRHKGLHLLILLLFHFSFQNSFFLFLLFFHYFYISLILFIKIYFVFFHNDVVHVNSVADFNLFFIISLLRYTISISSVTLNKIIFLFQQIIHVVYQWHYLFLEKGFLFFIITTSI